MVYDVSPPQAGLDMDGDAQRVRSSWSFYLLLNYLPPGMRRLCSTKCSKGSKKIFQMGAFIGGSLICKPLMKILINPLFPRHQFESFFPEVNTGKQMCDMVFRCLGNISLIVINCNCVLETSHLGSISLIVIVIVSWKHLINCRTVYCLALYRIGNNQPLATMILLKRFTFL